MTRRVGVVISTEHAGGGEQYLLRLFKGLAEDGQVEPHLLGRLAGWDELGLGSTDVGLGPKWSFRTLGRVLATAVLERRRALRAIREVHEREPFDVFHLQYKREQLLLTRSLSKMAPVVWTEHGRLPMGVKRRLLAPFYRWASQRTGRVIGVSKDVAQDVRDVCGGGVDAIAIENAIDERIFRPAADDAERRALRESMDLDPDAVVASVVTRLHPKKRVDRAIGLVAPDDSVTLLLAGDGPDVERLESLAAGRPVRFLGWIDDPSLIHRVSDISVLALTEQGEGFPTTLVEAASSGCVPVGFEGDLMADEVRAAGGVVVALDTILSETSLIDSLPERRAQALEWSRAYRLGPWLDAHAAVFDEVAARTS